MITDNKKLHSHEAQEWYFRLMNDPDQFEELATVGFLE